MSDPDRTLSYHVPLIAKHLAAAHGMSRVDSEAVMGELQKIARWAITQAGPVVNPPDPGAVAPFPAAGENFRLVKKVETEDAA